MKYSEELKKHIVELYTSAEQSIKAICKTAGITRKTFYEWRKLYPDFDEALKEAEEIRRDLFKHMARSGLAKLLEGYQYTETTTYYKPQKVVNKNGDIEIKMEPKYIKQVTKTIPPNVTACMYVLNNLDSKTFKHMTSKYAVDPEGQIIHLHFDKDDEDL